MYDTSEEREFVNDETQEKDEREPITSMIYKAGKQVRLLEFCGGTPMLGGKGNKQGRGSKDVSDADREKNKRKSRNRRKRDLKDCVNANEASWTAFDTYSYREEVRDPNVLVHDLDVYHKACKREVEKRFPDFTLKYTGTYGMQDGKRRKDKQGRYVLHAHEVTNLPYIETYVIVREDLTTKQGEQKGQHYLLNDGSWSVIATRETLYFDGGTHDDDHEQARRAAERYLEEHRQELQQRAGKGKRVKIKKLPLYTILWGKGHVHRRWFSRAAKQVRKYASKKGENPDFGAYMAGNYMLSDDDRKKLTDEELVKFEGKKGWYHSRFRTNTKGEEVYPGGLERVQKFYNEEAKQELIRLGAWDCLTRGVSFFIENENKIPGESSFEVGDVVMYSFNLHAKQYPTIHVLPLEKTSLKLDEDVTYMRLAIDEEVERRELEAQRAVMNTTPHRKEEVWIQEDFWGYSDAYRQQCLM